jgi:hypothetical protein
MIRGIRRLPRGRSARRLEDRASRIDAAARCRLAERLFNQPLQSRIANTTIMVIEIPLTVGAILRYHWWH